MAVRKIREEGDEILRKKSREVEIVDDRIRELLNDMVETMHKANGVGLSAVQVGVLKRVVVIDIYDDNYQITYNSNIDFQLSFLECKDYLIQVSTLNTGLYGNYCKYCVNKEALIQNIKQKIFDLTMTT